MTIAQEENFTQIFRVFIAKILDLMINYLPLDKSITETLDFVNDISDFGALTSKLMDFNKYFKVVDESQIPELKKYILKLTSTKRSKYEKDAHNVFHVWDRIEQDQSNNIHFVLLPKLANIAQSLPTSSADVEQTFSGVKLIKTLLRNKLSAEKVEAILLLIQAFGKRKSIIIEKKIVELYQIVREKVYERKRGKVRPSPVSEKQLRKEEEGSREEFKECNGIPQGSDQLENDLDSSENNQIFGTNDDEVVFWENVPVYGETIENEFEISSNETMEIKTIKEQAERAKSGMKKMKHSQN